MKGRDGEGGSGPSVGIFIEELGLYLLVERRGGRISSTSLSGKRPEAFLAAEEAEALMSCWLMPGEGPGKILDLTGVPEFQRAVLEAVASIPPGQTLTYGQIARKIGKPKAARAVGAALAKNPFPLVIPCHRVVAADGIGGYSGGSDLKRRLLDLEGDLPG